MDRKGKEIADYFFRMRAEEARSSPAPGAGPGSEGDALAIARELFDDANHGSSGIRFDDYASVPVERSGPGEEVKGGPAPLASFDELAGGAFAGVPAFVLENVKR